MTRYFLRSAGREDYDEQLFSSFSNIIEQLDDPELIFKLTRYPISGEKQPRHRLNNGISLGELFSSEEEGQSAAPPLVRFGFVKFISGYGAIVLYSTDRLFEFLDNFDVNDLEDAGALS